MRGAKVFGAGVGVGALGLILGSIGSEFGFYNVAEQDLSSLENICDNNFCEGLVSRLSDYENNRDYFTGVSSIVGISTGIVSGVGGGYLANKYIPKTSYTDKLGEND